MGEHSLAHELGLRVPFVKRKGKRYEDTGPPLAMVKQIMALGRRRGLRRLTGVTDLPVVTLKGEVLCGDDYDAESGLAVRCGDRFPSGGFDFPPGEAWRILWEPFSLFPFASEADRGGALAAVKRTGLKLQAGITFLRLYLQPVEDNEAPATVRLQPVW